MGIHSKRRVRRLLLAVTLILWAVTGSEAIAEPPASPEVMQGPPTFYEWVVPLELHGTQFSVPKSFVSCKQSWDAVPYVAPNDESLVLDGNVLLQPGCGPAPSSGETKQLYIVAIPVSGDAAHANLHYDVHSSFPAIAIAGPVNADESPWVFAPLQPALAMKRGKRYVFFVAWLVAV